MVVGEPAVFDHARRHLHQRHGVQVVAAVVARDIEHTEDVAARVEDGRGRAREKVVGVQVVLVGMHERGRLGHQRRAHGVGAFGRLRPVRARCQRHLRGAREKVVVTDRMQDGAGGVGQHHHAVGVDDLLMQHLHHRCGVVVQAQVALARDGQVGAAQGGEVGPLDARHAQGRAALMRFVDGLHVLGAKRDARCRGDRAHQLFGAASRGSASQVGLGGCSHACLLAAQHGAT